MQTASIPRSFRAAAALAAAAAACAAALQSVPSSAAQPRAAAPGPSWSASPAHGALFAPAAHRDAYRFFTTPRTLEDVLADIVLDPASMRAPGAWTPRWLLPSDAFGQSGPYDRWALARLFGARRAQVARGPRSLDGRVSESWTLISPYPDPSMARLEPGTLLAVLRLP